MDPDLQTEHAADLRALSVSLAKFTRNLAAAVPHNQHHAYCNEGTIRNLVYHYTSYAAIHDKAGKFSLPSSYPYPATRMLTQALSNLITDNDQLAQTMWSTYMQMPDERNILTRLFASPDARTVSSAFVLVLNCIHGSVRRVELLVEGPAGPRTCIGLLDRTASLFDAEESTEEGRAFDVGYEIASRVIESAKFGRLYDKLTVENEPITAHQTTLLKLLDAYLHTSSRACEVALATTPGDGDECLCATLTCHLLRFATYVQSSIQQALGSQGARPHDDPPRASSSQAGATPPLQQLDLVLPKVCEALVLVTQSLTTIALRAEETVSVSVASTTDPSLRPPSPRRIVAEARTSSGGGSVECLIETLRVIDAFVPRITYGKLVQRPSAPHAQRARPESTAPERTRASEDENERGDAGSAARAQDREPQNSRAAAQAFAHVKRDLVRLLGILAAHDRAVQDRVRGSDGIPVVMNLCVVDDYNPYLREHAIFALRNLLHGNLENQAVVDAVKPVGRWDEDKALQELRGDAAADSS
ncbi:spinocerebellar ataxia type 10 protein domain-containing protein [Daedaleopsis nitida]|nr:spinocerebellar ataxia type 10 protein domain-containing protein [Daedaleopsis nitida]